MLKQGNEIIHSPSTFQLGEFSSEESLTISSPQELLKQMSLGSLFSQEKDKNAQLLKHIVIHLWLD